MNKREVNKAIKEMDLFPNLKVVIAEYEKEASKLLEREAKLKEELANLQQAHTDNYLSQQVISDISELIYLQKANKNIIQETEIVNSLLEGLGEELTELKIKFTPLFLEAIQKDSQANSGKYSANAIVDDYRWEMISLIVELSHAMQSQYSEVANPVYRVFNDPKVKQKFPRLEYAFNREQWLPSYGESMPTVISKQDIFTARSGQISPSIKAPKGDK